jgi:transposase
MYRPHRADGGRIGPQRTPVGEHRNPGDRLDSPGDGKLEIPGNISIIALPAKCPELNPVENIWQFMRDNWLSNRVFTSYDNIVDHCCEAWNKLIDQPWRIMTIGRRNWARGS